MKNLLLLLILLFSIHSFSQTRTEKWNSLYERYEYFDSYGTMTGYKKYNSLNERWEYYDLNNNSNSVYQPVSSVDLPLVSKTLNNRQAKYDANFTRLKEEVKSCYIIIQGAAKFNGYTYDDGLKAVDFFRLNYIDKVNNGKYDLSSNDVTDKLIAFLANGSLKVACDYFKQCD